MRNFRDLFKSLAGQDMVLEYANRPASQVSLTVHRFFDDVLKINVEMMGFQPKPVVEAMAETGNLHSYWIPDEGIIIIGQEKFAYKAGFPSPK